MGEEIARAVIRIIPDATGFREKVDAETEAATSGVRKRVKVEVDADTTKAKVDVDHLKASLETLSTRVTTARANVDDREAQAKLLAIRAALLRIGAQVADPKIDLKGVAQAEAQLAALDLQLRKITADGNDSLSAVKDFGSGISAMGVSVAALLPAMPALAGGVIGLGAAFTAAGTAGLGFGAVVATALKQAQTANQELIAAQKAVDDATTSKAREVALEKQAALIQQLGPNVVALAQAEQGLAQQWKSFADSFTPDITTAVSLLQKLASDVLPQLRPMIDNTFGVIDGALKKMDAAAQSSSGQGFFHWLSIEGPHDLGVLLDATGKFGAGFAHLAEAFTPVERQLVQGIDNIAAKFDNWAKGLGGSASFQKFLAEVQKDGPLLVHTLGDVAQAAGRIGLALGPVLPLELKFIDGIATLINDHPAIASALGAIFLGFESLKVIGTLLGPLQVFASGLGAIGLGARAAAGETAGLAGRLAGLASIGEIVIPIVLAISVKEGLDAGSSALKKSDNPFKHLAGDVLGALSGGGMPGSPEFTNNILDAGNFIAGGTSPTAASDANLARLGGLNVTNAPAQPSGPGLFAGLASTIDQIAHAAGQAAGNSSVTSLASFYNPVGGVGSGALPLSGGGGGSNAAATAAQNNAAALAYLLGISIPTSLAQGVAAGTNPLTQTFQNLNQKLTGSAQTLANTLENVFSTALQYGQAAQQSLLPNVATGLPQLGTMTNVTVGPDGQLVRTQASPILGGLQLTLGNDKRFVDDVNRARKLGLSDTILRQFVQAGPSSLDQLDALVNGSPSDISAINSTYGQILSLGDAYGSQQAQIEYLSEMSGDLKNLIAAVASLVPSLPPAIGQQVANALNSLAAAQQIRAQNTPSKGVLAR